MAVAARKNAIHAPALVACRQIGVADQTFYRWRKEYGGMKADRARWLKELEQDQVSPIPPKSQSGN